MLTIQPKSAFISRDLSEAEVFARALRTAGWSVHGQSLIVLKAVEAPLIPNTDWVFFYSRNAVRFFNEQAAKNGYDLQSVQKAAIGDTTAKAMEALGWQVDFCGNGHPGQTAARFAARAQGKRVLFPQAWHSSKSIENLLKKKITAIPLVVYLNAPIPAPPKRAERVLVFTSPLNARTYLGAYSLLDGQIAIAIGGSTARALEESGLRNPFTAPSPYEADLAAFVLSVANNA